MWTGETLIRSCPQLSETVPPIFCLREEAKGQRYTVAFPRHTASLVWQTWASAQEIGNQEGGSAFRGLIAEPGFRGSWIEPAHWAMGLEAGEWSE